MGATGVSTPSASVEAPEPPCGSVVLLHGPTGTAYQRFHSGGLWYGAGQERGVPWAALCRRGGHRTPLVIYRAPD